MNFIWARNNHCWQTVKSNPKVTPNYYEAYSFGASVLSLSLHMEQLQHTDIKKLCDSKKIFGIFCDGYLFRLITLVEVFAEPMCHSDPEYFRNRNLK